MNPLSTSNSAEQTASQTASEQTESDTTSPVEDDANTSQSERENLIDTPPQEDNALLPVVGLGGSAGSIKALQEFFGRIPTNLGVAYVVVVHLSPDFESQLSRILQNHTRMPVVQVQNSVVVAANHVYVIPPAHHLAMDGEHIHLTEPQQDKGKRVAIDLFFRTLATARRSKAAAIVLSGADGDGSIGIKRIKEHGGVTIAQSPEEAQYPSMPRSAIETGMVDWVLTIEQMTAKVVEWVGNDQKIRLPSSEEPSPEILAKSGAPNATTKAASDALQAADETALREVLAFVHLSTGHDFSHYKRATILRRIMRRLQVNSLESIPQYVEYLHTHPGEAGALLQDLLISVTNFFRDPEAYVALQTYLPGLFRGVKAGEMLRVWVPGCATGEEAYSLAMILAEYGETLDNPPEVQIFATDLDDQALKVAREAIYPATIRADVSPERLRRFFVFDQDRYRVKKEVRERVLFASHNLLRDAPFSRLDLVSCRNLLIYFGRRAQDKVMDVFHFALKPNALLFLGSSESAEESHLFRPENKKYRIYERQISARSGFLNPLPNLLVPAPSSMTPARSSEAARALRALTPQLLSPAPQPRDLGNELANLPSRLAELASALASLPAESTNFPAEITDSAFALAVLLSTIAVKEPKAATTDSAIAITGSVATIMDSVIANVDSVTTIVDSVITNADSVIAIAESKFAALDAPLASFGALHLRLLEQSAPPSVLVNADYEIIHLSARAGGYLRMVGGEVSTNLLSMVHPALRLGLRAALFRAVQSGEDGDVAPTAIEIDGQMRNVGARVRPMRTTADEDMRGLFVLVIFDEMMTVGEMTLPAPDLVARRLDNELQYLREVLRASVEQHEASSEELKASNEELLALNEEQHAAAEELETSREEISAANEELTTVNSELKSNIEQLSRTNDDLRNLISSTDIATVFLSRDGHIKRYTPRAVDLFRLIPSDIGRPLADLHHPFGEDFLSEAAQSVLRTLSTQEREVRTLDDKWFLIRLSPYRTLEDKIDGVVLSFVDITTRKRIEASKLFLASIVESSQDSVVSIDLDGNISSWNRAAEELYGYPASEVLGKAYTMLTLPEDLREILGNVEKAKRDRTVEIFDALRSHKDGHQMNMEVMLSPVKNEGGEVVGVSTIARDVTQRRQAEEARRVAEERYRTLFDTIDEGFLLGQAVRHADGTRDFIIQEVNPAYERITGISRMGLAGRLNREALPGLSEEVYEIADRVGFGGESVMIDMEVPPLNLWIHAHFSPLGSDNLFAIVFDDITERKRAEAALLASEVKYRTLFESINDGFCLLERVPATTEIATDETALDFRYVEINPAALAHLGLAPGSRVSDVQGQTIRQFFPREAEGLDWAQIYDGVLRDGKAVRFERVMAPQGNVLEFHAFRVEDGSQNRVAVIFNDITERKMAQEVVRESEERLLTLIESVGDYAIFTLDADGIIDSWNSGAERIFGYTASEMQGQEFAMLFTPEDRAAGLARVELDTAEREGSASDERWHLRKDGTHFFASGVLTILRRGPRRGFVKIARDLTAQKQAETLLREGEARIRTISDAIPQMIWTNQPDGWADYFNRRWYEFSGLNYEQSAGRGWEAMVHPDDAASATEKWRLALAAGEVFDVEYRLRRADGVYCWHIGRNVPLRDEEGRVIGWFGTNTDIQDLKGAQAALRMAHDELEWRVEERTEDLGEALVQLREEIIERKKIEAARRDLLGRLVNSQEEERGRISRELHDNLGQHLTAVMLGLKTLESQTQSMHPDETTQASFGNLSGLVDALMRAAHRQAWELRPAELDDMGLEVALRHYVSDWGKRIAIPIDFHSTGWENERLDPALEIVLYRVVQEALTNVARHSGATSASVILELNAAGASAIIEDNGSGFSPEPDQGRLGLLGMRERLALVGGTLEIESTPGEATTLFARVPHAPPDAESAGESPETGIG